MSDPNGDPGREVLPIPERKHVGITTYDAKDPETEFPPIEPLRPPAGAPNVLVILIDDAGFGSSSAFGGPCQTPSFERLAKDGLRYTRFHTTALCSPTRAALLSGRNHHSVGMGGITEIATSAPGYSSVRPKDKAPAAEVLKLNGYSTAHFGKCHEVPVWETSPMGPFDRWPSPGNGFEHFYGFIGGETNQYAPALYRDTVPVEQDRTPEEGYHFTEDMTDRAIEWVRQQKALMPDKPFFVYYAPGATHAPHHVAPEWSAKYKGKFDQGWDELREETFARQQKLGVVPDDAELTERPAEIPAWDEIDDDLKPVLSRQMEVYAGFMEHTDHHVGRLLDALEDLEVLDDTLVYCIIGDNGASAEGGLHGSLQRAHGSQRCSRPADDRVHGLADRRLRHAEGVQPLRGRLGARHGHAVPVDEADRLPLGRDAQRHHRPLAERDQGEGRGPQPVPPRHRRRPHRPRGGRPARARVRQRHPAGAARRGVDGLLVRRGRRARPAHDAVLRDVRQPRHLPRGLDRRHAALDALGPDQPAARARRRRLGALRPRRLDAGPEHRLRAAREARLAPAPVPDRGGQVQRAPAGRPPGRALQRRPRRPAAAHPRQHADPVRRHGQVVGELGRRPQEQVARGHGRHRRARHGRCPA